MHAAFRRICCYLHPNFTSVRLKSCSGAVLSKKVLVRWVFIFYSKKCSLPVFSFLGISESADSEMCCIYSKNLCLVASYSCLKFSFQHCPVSEIYEFTILFQYHLALAPPPFGLWLAWGTMDNYQGF